MGSSPSLTAAPRRVSWLSQTQYLSIAEAAWAATQSGGGAFPLPVPPKDRGRKWLPTVEVADRRNVKRLYNGVISASSNMCVWRGMVTRLLSWTQATRGDDKLRGRADAHLSCAPRRNKGWVDGVGPGWAPVDTWISRSRAAWGDDSILLKGCFLRCGRTIVTPMLLHSFSPPPAAPVMQDSDRSQQCMKYREQAP